jgi:hypothetical protein
MTFAVRLPLCCSLLLASGCNPGGCQEEGFQLLPGDMKLQEEVRAHFHLAPVQARYTFAGFCTAPPVAEAYPGLENSTWAQRLVLFDMDMIRMHRLLIPPDAQHAIIALEHGETIPNVHMGGVEPDDAVPPVWATNHVGDSAITCNGIAAHRVVHIVAVSEALAGSTYDGTELYDEIAGRVRGLQAIDDTAYIRSGGEGCEEFLADDTGVPQTCN